LIELLPQFTTKTFMMILYGGRRLTSVNKQSRVTPNVVVCQVLDGGYAPY